MEHIEEFIMENKGQESLLKRSNLGSNSQLDVIINTSQIISLKL